MVRNLVHPFIAAALACSLHAHDMEDMSPAAPAAAGDSLEALVALALKVNPSIKAMEYQVKSLHASPSHVWYLEPPQVGVEFFQAPVKSFPDPLKNQMEIDYSLQQAFPFPGKISSRIDAEHKHALMSEAGLEGLRRKLAREVKLAYYGLYLLDRRREINARNRALMGRLVEIARRQYEVGLGRQADILRAQTESTNLRADSLELEQSRRATAGMLNALLRRPVTQPILVADTLAAAEIDWPLERIGPLLESQHPGLRGMQAAIEMRRAEKTAATREYWPDFTVAGSYKDMLLAPPGTHGGQLQDYWSVGVSMNVPVALWSLPKYKAGVVRSEADLAQAEAEYADLKNMLLARAQEALLKVDASREQARLSRAVLVPQAEQALASTLSSYEAGKSEFMALLDSYRMSLAAKENAEAALMRLLSSQAELEEAVGMTLAEMRNRMAEGAVK